MNYKSQEKLRLRLNGVRKRRAIKEAIPKNKMIEILKAQHDDGHVTRHMITDTLRGMDKRYINQGYTMI
jgi:hypothetical protein